MLRPWDLQINIDVNCHRAVYIQIADAIKLAISTGKLSAGDALPGSRQLAAKIKVNRNTIIDALEELLAEGWLISKERKGTFVADNLPASPIQKTSVPGMVKQAAFLPPEIVFDDGLPDTSIAPIKELAAAYRQIFSRKGRRQLMGYSQPAGEADFRAAIVQMLNYKRGMRLNVDEIFITRGSQMAMYLSAHCLLEHGDYVAVENPGYKPAWQTFENAGAKILPIAVDAEGMVVADLKAQLSRHKKIKAVYTTPHHQFPTTVSLSTPRRLELIDLSNQYGFTIIEDDYDNEFHFGQQQLLPLSSYENLENYIYIGTMSKIVAPALRLGYLASSAAFLEKAGRLRKIIDVQGDNIMAQAVLELINDGHIKRHLKKATVLYKNKRDYFEKMAQQYLEGKADFTRPEGGLAFWLSPKKLINSGQLIHQLSLKGVQLMNPRDFSFDKPVNGLRLGYASPGEKQLEQGLRILASLL